MQTEMPPSEIRAEIENALDGDAYSVWANDRTGQNEWICAVQRGEKNIAEVCQWHRDYVAEILSD